jgi:regulator of RNase E activity RraA
VTAHRSREWCAISVRDFGFADLSTATLSDALDLTGLEGCLPGLSRLSGAGLVTGPAFTLRYAPAESPGDGNVGDFIDDVPPGSVVVIANSGRTDCTVWGDILSRVAVLRGLAGCVIDGVCRDVDGSRAAGFSIWARAAYMRTGKGRVKLVAVQEPVTVAGRPVSPGDLVCGDGSGALVIPAASAERVVGRAREIAAAEQAIVAETERGASLRDARSRFGYHRIAAGGDLRAPRVAESA